MPSCTHQAREHRQQPSTPEVKPTSALPTNGSCSRQPWAALHACCCGAQAVLSWHDVPTLQALQSGIPDPFLTHTVPSFTCSIHSSSSRTATCPECTPLDPECTPLSLSLSCMHSPSFCPPLPLGGVKELLQLPAWLGLLVLMCLRQSVVAVRGGCSVVAQVVAQGWLLRWLLRRILPIGQQHRRPKCSLHRSALFSTSALISSSAEVLECALPALISTAGHRISTHIMTKSLSCLAFRPWVCQACLRKESAGKQRLML